MYCTKKNKFKEFGFDKDKTLLSFPFTTIFTGIILYILFAMVDIISIKLR
jgi:hypothetical protein